MGVQNSLKIDGVTEIYPGAVVLPGGGKTFLVQSSGAAALSDLPAGFAGNPDGFFTSVNAAAAACRANRGDKIVCLPNHTETLTTANAWSNLTVAGVEIIGIGAGVNRPTFTWNAATATVLLNQQDTKLRNCNLFLAGPHSAGSNLTVAAPITASAAGVEITDCSIAYGFNATQIVGIGITTTAGATFFNFSRNSVYAETAAVPTTTFLRLTGANWMRMDDTLIIGPGSTTSIGPVQMLTTACLKLNWNRSEVVNTLASNTAAVTGIAGCTGMLTNVGLGILSGTAPWTNLSGIATNACYYSLQAGAAGTLF